MKKLCTILLFAITLIANAQAPQGFNYQATVRNSAGVLITNQNVNFNFHLILNSQNSSPIYSETHVVLTDDLGQVNVIIGSGNPTLGTFSNINWGSGTYYLGIELNTGSGYVAMGTTQLLSVPFALYANNSGNAPATTPNLADVLSVNNSANNTKITNLLDPTDAQDAVTKGYTDAAIAQLESLIATLHSQVTALQNASGSQPISSLPSVQIGTQIWQNVNLDVTMYRDSTPIPQVTDPSQWANLTTGAWCYYNNNAANDSIYGKLYNWYAVAGIHDAASLNDPSLRKQLAPQGWHIPSDTEWTTLTTFLGGTAVAGGKMKSTSTTLWQNPNTDATNESGFSGFPGGYQSNGGHSSGITSLGYWWSSTESDTDISFLRCLFSWSGAVTRTTSNKKMGFSVRCISDNQVN